MDGNSLTPKKLKPIMPKRTKSRFITIASTGLFMLVLDKLMRLFSDFKLTVTVTVSLILVYDLNLYRDIIF